MANFCENCGSPLKEGYKFCENCGAPVKEAVVAAAAAAPETPEPMQENMVADGAEKPVAGLPARQEEPASDFRRTANPARGGLGAQYEPDEDFQSMFLRYDNRLNRKRYIMRSLMLMAAGIAISVVIGFLASATGIMAVTYLSRLVSIVSAIISCMLTIRRLHDLNRPAWWCIGIFIPLVNFVMAVYLLFFKGTDGPNDYGSDPLTVQD